MFIPAQIIAGFRGLVGFEDSENAEVPDIDADLQGSTSGRYVTGSGLLTYENILNAATQFERVNVKPWSALRAYKAGNITTSGGNTYQAIADHINHVPPDVLYWKATNLFSAYLRRMYDKSVLNLIGSIFTEKKLNVQGRTLLGSSAVFSGSGHINDFITRDGKFRGLKITLKHPDTTVSINHIALQLTGAQNPVPLKLYHSAVMQPLQTIDINHPAANAYKWKKLDTPLLLPWTDLSTRTGGSYYIGYDEADLTVDAIERRNLPFYNNRSRDCSTCTDVVENSNLFRQWSQYVDIHPFYVDEQDLYMDGTIWDPADEHIESGVTYGINLQLTIQCDLTASLLLNSGVLAEVLVQQLKVDLLNEMNLTLRDNQKSQALAQLAALSLDDRGDQGAKTPGELSRLAALKKAVSIDLNNLSKICLPCVKKTLTLGNIWNRR